MVFSKTIRRSWVAMAAIGLLALGGCVTAPESGTQAALDKLSKVQPQPGPMAPVTPGAVALEDAQINAVITRWISGLGGVDRLKKVKSVRCFISMEEGGGPTFLQTVETPGGRYRYEVVYSNPLICGGYDGTQSWQDSGQWGSGIFPGTRGDPLWSLVCLKALELNKYYPTQKLVTDEEVEGRPCVVIEMVSAERKTERWYFERASGNLVRVLKDLNAGQKPTIHDFSDFRREGKILIPRTLTVTHEGGGKTVFYYARVELNVALDGIAFSASPAVIEENKKIDSLIGASVQKEWDESDKNRTFLARASIFSNTNGIETELTVYRKPGDKVLVEKVGSGMGRTAAGYNGTVGWENSEVLGYHQMKDEEIRSLVTMAWLGFDPYLQKRFPVRAWVGDKMVDGKPATAIMLRNFGEVKGLFYFSKENSCLIRVEIDENPQQHVQPLKVDYEDFRQIGSILVPFKVTYKNPSSETVITCKSVELDTAMPDTLFEPRTDVD